LFTIAYEEFISPKNLGFIINHLREKLTRCLFYEHDNCFVDLSTGKILAKFIEPGDDSGRLTESTSFLDFTEHGEKSPREISCARIDSHFLHPDELTSYLKTYNVDNEYVELLTGRTLAEGRRRSHEGGGVPVVDLKDFLSRSAHPVVGKWTRKESTSKSAKEDRARRSAEINDFLREYKDCKYL